MPEMLFCYHCRVHHPKGSMRMFPTRLGKRWRCLQSIEASRQDVASREAFGRLQSEINREVARRQARYAHLMRFPGHPA